MLSEFMTPWTKPDQHPAGQQGSLSADDALEEAGSGIGKIGGPGAFREMPPERVFGQRAQQRIVSLCGGVFERAHADVAGSNPREDCAWQRLLTKNCLAGEITIFKSRHPEVEGNAMSQRFIGGATFLSHAAWWTGMSTLREEVLCLTRIAFDG